MRRNGFGRGGGSSGSGNGSGSSGSGSGGSCSSSDVGGGGGGGGGVGGVCGRPASWCTGTWRLPYLVSTSADSTCDESLIETCEEEAINVSVDSGSDMRNYKMTDKSKTNRLQAKTSLDETKLRTRSGVFDNLDRKLDTSLNGGKFSIGNDTGYQSGFIPGCPGDLKGTSGRTLARSSSYQALHSALARLYRLDDFTTERLGQGFFSEVFKVWHRVTGEVMVLKMNKLESNRHNMLREVELMNRLHHRNILSYYGVCVHEGQVHALTEFINGGALDGVLQSQEEITWSERVSLAADIARGMTYLHKQGFFHRDLTSKNVLIKQFVCGGRKRREAVVADFGLAAPIPKDKSVRMRQVGSVYWMAPEVIRGEWYDYRVDVFSFGIILCEMIARCDADPDVLPRTNNFGVHYLAFSRMCQSDCPPYFLQIAFQCCQIDPDTRPSFDVLTKNLEALHSRLTGHKTAAGPRKHKVSHRRSLSDDYLMMGRGGGSGDDSTANAGQSAATGSNSSRQSTNAVLAAVGQTPQEVLERMGEADPYFTPSTATVNPFTRIKLPAPSRLTVQDGSRFCHSLPDPLPSRPHHHITTIKPRPPPPHNGSNSNLCPPPSSIDPARQSGSCGGGSPHVQQNLAGAVKRRGSGESGFFSVGDMDRTGTPDLWLSYSELSCPSLAWEEEERSWVTDSSDDLCAPDEPDTDIKAIVEFFERGYGSLRRGALIPNHTSRLSPRSPASPPHGHLWGTGARSGVKGIRPSCIRRETFKVKDRPKLYITEGTVRAKRDIFEAK